MTCLGVRVGWPILSFQWLIHLSSIADFLLSDSEFLCFSTKIAMASMSQLGTDHTRKEGTTALVWTDGSTGSSVGRAIAAVTVAGTTRSPIVEARVVPTVVITVSTLQTRTLTAIAPQTRTFAAIILTATTTVPALVKTKNTRFVTLDVTEGQLIIINQVPHGIHTIQFVDPGCGEVPDARLGIIVDHCCQSAQPEVVRDVPIIVGAAMRVKLGLEQGHNVGVIRLQDGPEEDA